MWHPFMLFISMVLLLVGCDQPKSDQVIRVGVTAGPHAMIMDEVKNVLEKDGWILDIKEFNDFNLPNRALSEGDLDVNSFQHQPYLDEQNERLNLNLVSVGKTVLMPLGLYSKRYQKIEEIPLKAHVSIPNDPTNEGRSLRLLERLGLITLDPTISNPTLGNIIDNPKHLQIFEIEAPQLPRTLDDVDLAVINTDWVLLSGLDPMQSLAQETLDSPYTNVLVVRKESTDHPGIMALIKAYQSPRIKSFIKETFKGAVLPAW